MYMSAEALMPSLLKVAQDAGIIKSKEFKFIPELDKVMEQECKDINEEYKDWEDPKKQSFLVVCCGVAAASAVWGFHNDYENFVKTGIYDYVESQDEEIFEVSEKYYKSNEIVKGCLAIWSEFNKQIVKQFFDSISDDQHLQFCIAMFMIGMMIGMEKCGL